MTRAVIHARYSSDQQSAASIDDQLRLCKERVAREGWSLTEVYRDAAMSGASALRPGYQALLEGVRGAEFDVIVVEALDRLTRDQEDVAALHKRCGFAGVRIVTITEGEITELHVGLKGTMNALFLKHLADKTRRGLRGRIEAGASGGGLTYGYDVVCSLERRGERRINEAEAAVVRRIFQAYADGLSPKRIAFELNGDGVLAPRGGQFAAITINGNRERGTGILNNELYVGRLVWTRLHCCKDPDTGRRCSRPNVPGAVIIRPAPDLRIVDNTLWAAAQARQSGLGTLLHTGWTTPRNHSGRSSMHSLVPPSRRNGTSSNRRCQPRPSRAGQSWREPGRSLGSSLMRFAMAPRRRPSATGWLRWKYAASCLRLSFRPSRNSPHGSIPTWPCFTASTSAR